MTADCTGERSTCEHPKRIFQPVRVGILPVGSGRSETVGGLCDPSVMFHGRLLTESLRVGQDLIVPGMQK
jgi:hypothetical protein